MMNCADIAQHFRAELKAGRIVRDRNGHGTVELIGASFIADAPAIIGTPNEAYIEREIRWYDSLSLNVNDMGRVPEQWRLTASPAGAVNSNYGYLVYSRANCSQYAHVLAELRANPDTRRACMVYNRPRIWHDYRSNGKNDFICTNAVTYYRRDGQLSCVVQMRSNDVVYGYKNDRAWQREVLKRLAADLGDTPGTIHWQVQNLHVYERHFALLEAA